MTSQHFREVSTHSPCSRLRKHNATEERPKTAPPAYVAEWGRSPASSDLNMVPLPLSHPRKTQGFILTLTFKQALTNPHKCTHLRKVFVKHTSWALTFFKNRNCKEHRLSPSWQVSLYLTMIWRQKWFKIQTIRRVYRVELQLTLTLGKYGIWLRFA